MGILFSTSSGGISTTLLSTFPYGFPFSFDKLLKDKLIRISMMSGPIEPPILAYHPRNLRPLPGARSHPAYAYDEPLGCGRQA